MAHIILGGDKAKDEERLYLKPAKFSMPDGSPVTVTPSVVEGADMNDVIARHRARYYLPALYCRSGQDVLDFPCGSGYGAEILDQSGINYWGVDLDAVAVQYAQRVYGGASRHYSVGNLKSPHLSPGAYDVIACIEGLEHIGMEYQDDLIWTFRAALKLHGVLIVSSPENLSGTSGQGPDNKYHVGELTKTDFIALLCRHFGANNVEILTHSAVLTTGKRTNCFYGICHL